MKKQQNKNQLTRKDSEQDKNRKNNDDSSEQSPKKKQKPGCRKIPQTLIQSYDLITLKQQKKKRFNFKRQQSKQQQTKNPDLQQMKPLFGECCCTEDLKEQFSQKIVYQLTTSLFVLSKVCSFRIRDVTKIKLIGIDQGQQSQLKPKILKITWGETIEQSEQSCDIFVKLNTIEQAYFLFSSIITRKLLLQDFTLVDICKNQNKSFDGAIKNLEGDIFKVSTFIRKWQKKPAKIGDKLQIFKQGKLYAQIKNTKQIWTRFNMHNGYFVIKMFQGIQKIQIGIPLTDYSNVQSNRNWLFLLAKLIK